MAAIAGGKGTVKYPGYKTGGKLKPKGMRNKRSEKRRKIKEAEIRAKRERQRKREERENAYAAFAHEYEPDY